MENATGGNNDLRNLSPTPTFDPLSFVNNTLTRLQGKRTNEVEQGPKEVPKKPPFEVAASTSNTSDAPDPGLVEKLMQQLNDLKEMVCVVE